MARKKRTWVGIAVSLLCLYLVFHSLDAEALADALRQTNFLYVVPALGVYFLGVWLRSLRWRLLLGPALRARVAMPVAPDSLAAASPQPGAGSASLADAIHPAPTTPPPTGRLFRVLVIGFTVNNLLPARLGEIARAYLLWRGERIEPGTTLATIVLERVLDGLTLLTFAGVAALIVPFPAGFQQAAWVTAGVFLLAVIGLVVFMLWPTPFVALALRVLRLLPARFAHLEHLAERLVLTFVDGLAVLRQARALASVLALSLIAWLAEATMYYVIMLGFPFPARPEAALLGAAAANIGTMIPSSPGYVGTFDLPLQKVLVEVFGVPLALATSYTLVLHAALVLPVVVLGLFFVWRDRATSDEGHDGTPPPTGGRGLLSELAALGSRKPPTTTPPMANGRQAPEGRDGGGSSRLSVGAAPEKQGRSRSRLTDR
jgi:glycosyltransferase 2 family protein